MKIQLISFRKNAKSNVKLDLTIKIFNESTCDLLLFPGHTVDTVSDLEKLSLKLNNKKTTAFLELKELGSRGITNWSFKIEGNKLINCHSHQLFATSSEIKNNPFLGEILFNEIKNNRLHKVKSKKICLLQCGELNILTNIQNNNNKVIFRTKQKDLLNDYVGLFNSFDIILNPLHTPMGNQGKMHKRRVYLSRNHGAYFSTANVEKTENSFEESFRSLKSLQYAYLNGKEINNVLKEAITPDYLSREFSI